MNISFLLLDVCKTLVNFQTANKYVLYVLTEKNAFIRLVLCRWYRIFYRLFGGKEGGLKYKYAILKLLQGENKKKLEEIAKSFFEQHIIANINAEVLNLIDKVKSENSGAKLVVVSAGYDLYLQYLKEYLQIDYMVCSRLSYNGDVFSGKLERDCFSQNKIYELRDHGILQKICFEKAMVVSDSYSDLPLFAVGKYKIAVNPDRQLSFLVGKGWDHISDFLRN